MLCFSSYPILSGPPHLQIEEPHLLAEVVKLQAAIKYREDDVQNARVLVGQSPADDPDTAVNLACLDYKACSRETQYRTIAGGELRKGTRTIYKRDPRPGISGIVPPPSP